MAAVDETVSRILTALCELDSNGSRRVSASDFQAVLDRFGASPGSHPGDFAVRHCRVETNGRVDFSGLERALQMGPNDWPVLTELAYAPPPPPPVIGAPPPRSVTSQPEALLAARSATASTPHGQAGPAPAYASPYKISRPSFRPPPPTPVDPARNLTHSAASAHATVAQGSDRPAAARPATFGTLLELDAKDRVHQCTPQLRDLFRRYDSGRLTVERLGEGVAQLGLEVTPAFRSLLRSAPLDMTFSQLYQSLLQVSEPAAATTVKLPAAHALSGSPARPPQSPTSRESLDSPWGATLPPSAPAIGSSRKDQVYAEIRRLVAGETSTRAFSRAMHALGLQLSQEVTRLLTKADINGAVNFQQLALAMDPLIRPVTPPSPPRFDLSHVAQGNRAVPLTPSPRSPRRPPPADLPATRDHGDLIAWSNPPGLLEELEEDARPAGRRHCASQVPPSQVDHIDLTWDASARQAPPSAAAQEPYHHLRTSRANRDSVPGLLTWNVDERRPSSAVQPRPGQTSYPFAVQTEPIHRV